MKKLAFCIFKYFPYGGLQQDFLGVVMEALRRGYRVDVYTRSWRGEIPEGLNIILIKVRALTNHAKALQFSQKVQSYFHRGAYDGVVGFNRIPGLDVCFMGDNCFAESLSKKNLLQQLLPRYRTYQALEKFVCSAASRTEIILINDDEQRVFQKHYMTQTARFHLLAPWVKQKAVMMEQEEIIRADYRHKFFVAADEVILIFVAVDFENKGLARALVAVASLPEEVLAKVTLWVVGGEEGDSQKKLVEKLNLVDSVKFLGARADVQSLMLAADILVHPAKVELAGKVIVEALVNNLPVLTTKVCGCARYIEEAQSGVVLPFPFDQQAMNQKLFEMLDDVFRQKLKEHARCYQAKQQFYDFPSEVMKIVEDSVAKKSISRDDFFLHASLRGVFSANKSSCINEIFSLQGKVYRKVKNRQTIRVSLGHQSCFVKMHHGVGWREVVKNLCFLRWPVVSAKQEFLAIQSLSSLGVAVPEVLAYAERGNSLATIQSFIVLREVVYQQTLEDLALAWKKKKPTIRFKRNLIRKVAEIARVMHQHGLNHRDFYLCHFLLNQVSDVDFSLTLIDLHRMQIRKVVPKRWLIKDLSGLYFSAMDAGLTKHDFICFVTSYHQCSLHEYYSKYTDMWRLIKKRALRQKM